MTSPVSSWTRSLIAELDQLDRGLMEFIILTLSQLPDKPSWEFTELRWREPSWRTPWFSWELGDDHVALFHPGYDDPSVAYIEEIVQRDELAARRKRGLKEAAEADEGFEQDE